MDHRIGSVVFGVVVGVAVAAWSYQWITNPATRAEREQQERVVLLARELLASRLQQQDLEIVDPLAPRRKVGKVYVFPIDDGWEISGYYRRGEHDDWHAWLMTLDAGGELQRLKVDDDDSELRRLGRSDPLLDTVP